MLFAAIDAGWIQETAAEGVDGSGEVTAHPEDTAATQVSPFGSDRFPVARQSPARKDPEDAISVPTLGQGFSSHFSPKKPAAAMPPGAREVAGLLISMTAQSGSFGVWRALFR